MSTTQINFIGCGRLGKTIAKLIKIHQLGTLQAIKNSSFESSIKAVQFIGEGQAYLTFQDLPRADIYFITTPDDQIQSSCEQLAHKHFLKKDAIVVHASGSLTSSILASAKEQGCHIASIHPIKSFANPTQCIHDFSGTFCAIEGDEKAIAFIAPLFEKMGGIIFTVNKDHKTLYHAACVIANNYLITLHHAAFQCFKEARIEEVTAKKLASTLMKSALNNIDHLTHEAALTGPLQRGDIQTVLSHLQTLNVNIKTLYSTLGLATLPLTEQTTPTKEVLLKLLTKDA
jgi:predicted short-subunit dehydrogenase-like oxidoreductase (DUF2520 family)